MGIPAGHDAAGRRVRIRGVMSYGKDGDRVAREPGGRIMAIKSFRDIATSLSGSAFRRITHDGRARMLREVPTWGGLEGRRRGEAIRPAGGTAGHGRALGIPTTATR
jgi:hypothetical protein